MHLEVSGVYKQFHTSHGLVVALKDINMHIEEGEFVCGLGASGVRKINAVAIDCWFGYADGWGCSRGWN
jgi:ABC-type nitrate/sulfonate/bicarbonate transport system ATPase subunit